MCETMIENDVAKWEMRRLEHKAARLYRAKRLRGKGTKRLVAGLAALISRPAESWQRADRNQRKVAHQGNIQHGCLSLALA